MSDLDGQEIIETGFGEFLCNYFSCPVPFSHEIIYYARCGKSLRSPIGLTEGQVRRIRQNFYHRFSRVLIQRFPLLNA